MNILASVSAVGRDRLSPAQSLLFAFTAGVLGFSVVCMGSPLEFTLTFDSIPLDFNGSVDTPSGDVTVVVTVDTGATDTEPNANFGSFVADSAFITAPTLGLANVAFTTPVAVFLGTDPDSIGLSFGGTGNFATRTGFWNYQNFDPDFTMTDPNDLSTFVAPYTGADNDTESNLQFLTTFNGSPNITLANGDYFDGGQNSSPGIGNVTIGASVVAGSTPVPSDIISFSKSGNTATVVFTGEDGVSYRLTKSPDYTFSATTTVDNLTLSPSGAGTLEDTSATGDAAFYRVER